MIDGVNISYNTPPETNIRDWDFWETLVNAKTLKRVTDKYTANFRGLDFTLIEKQHGNGYRLNIRGSLHKYFNQGLHNADRFTFMDLVQSIDSLTDITGISPDKFELHGLEIGLNIPLPPIQILRNLVSYGNKGFDYINKKKINLGFEVALKQYSVKVYDKGKQSGKAGNVLRFEIAFKKMQPLAKYGIATLADLTEPAKVYPLISVLLEALSRVIWTDRNTDLSTLTDREQKQFLFYQDAKNWESMNKRQRTYHVKKWKTLLKKSGKVYDLKQDVLTGWQGLFEKWQADFIRPFYQLEPKRKQLENVTFLPLVWCVKKSEKDTDKTDPEHVTNKDNIIENINSAKNAQMTKGRVCVSCGKDITHQHKNSRFCSAKFVGERKAKQCRNKDSNKRLSKKRKIYRAMKKDHFLKITYRDESGTMFTDILHPKELHINKSWLDRVQSIENIKSTDRLEAYRKDKSADTHPTELKGEAAKEYLKTVTKIYQ